MTDDKATKLAQWGGFDGSAEYIYVPSKDGQISLKKTDKVSLWVDAKGGLWRRMDGVSLFWQPKAFQGVTLPELRSTTVGDQMNFGIDVDALKSTPHEQITGNSPTLQSVIAGVDQAPAGSTSVPMNPFPTPSSSGDITITPLGLGVAIGLALMVVLVVLLAKGVSQGYAQRSAVR